MIQLGLRLHDAEKLPVEELLPLVRKKGFTCSHLALSKLFKDLPCTPAASRNPGKTAGTISSTSFKVPTGFCGTSALAFICMQTTAPARQSGPIP